MKKNMEKETVKSTKRDVDITKKKKSKITLWWEKNPNGIGSEIINMRAVLR